MRTYYFLQQGQSFQRISLEGDPPVVTDILNIGPIEPNCKINISYNLAGDGFGPCILCHEQTTGNIFYYWDDRGTYRKTDVLGNIPVEWKLQACRFLNQWGTGEFGGTQIFGHNQRTEDTHPNYGKVQIWNNITDLTKISDLTADKFKIGPEWELMLGDVDGDRFVDIVGRNTAADSPVKGILLTWFLGAGGDGITIKDSRYSGQIGLEWKLQVADMNFDGFADLFGYDETDDCNLWVWYNIEDGGRRRGVFDAGKSYGKFGKDWQQLQITSLGSAHPSLDILGLATNGEVHSWPTTGAGLRDHGVSVGRALGWTALAGLPQTRFV